MNLADHPSNLDSGSAFEAKRSAKVSNTPEAIIRNMSNKENQLTKVRKKETIENFEVAGIIDMKKIEEKILNNNSRQPDISLTSSEVQTTIRNMHDGYELIDPRVERLAA